MTAPDIALVVVSHDSCEELLACLGTAGAAREVVVVDSGSHDSCVAEVERHFPEVVDVLRLANVGFGQAANAGVARTTTDVVVVANADTRFAAGALEALARAFRDAPRAALVGPRVVYPDGRPQASARRFPSPVVAVGHALLGLWKPDNPWTRAYRPELDASRSTTVDWVSGCAVAVRRAAFDEAGGFDPGYFMFVEDVDLAWRLADLGWEVRYEPASEVVHTVGASTSRYPGALAFEHARSLHRFWRRAYGRGAALLLDPLVRIGLTGWATMAWAWRRLVAPRRGRSSTGE